MGNTFPSLKHWYDKHIKQIREPPIKLIDPIFHHHKIKTYGIDLRNAELPLEERATAALYIGLLAYTGGVSAARLAAEYIQDMIDILIMPNTSGKVMIAVLKGLCGACYINCTNQNEAKENHLAEVLIAYLDEDEDSPDADPDIILVKFWVCYLMTVVCCNNIPYIKLLQEMGEQTLQKRLESLSNKEWLGWPQNYAELMFLLMGYQKTKI
ncbi:armadillo-like helical domain-containing protein 2 [Sceloporus undulatus]|uniref:armadillo-like helical domain-containing protein 2 n=1 Tax=Sceloporus undulatus TaxID=8520 RepID=UPI001C4C6F0A|nr:armadillo-like helical domain-containing protein 2 [Sceloporus undulatus]